MDVIDAADVPGAIGQASTEATRIELTTVATTSATFHQGTTTTVLDGLTPSTTYEHCGIEFTTLARPTGALRCRFATLNDVHFGEVEAGRLGTSDLGPILRGPPGAPPYPEMMNHAAVDELVASEAVTGPFAAVIVKGDLTSDGTPLEFAAFEACYRPPFGTRLHAVRGNHDSYRGQSDYAGDEWIDLPGVAVALVDTAVPHHTGGELSPEQFEWLDARAAASTDPVVVMGHHPQFLGANGDEEHFILSRRASAGLDDLFRRRDAVVAYTAGHTHRHRVQHAAAGVPSIEVGCVKDFPGTWAEYEIYEGGLLQIIHRVSSAEALTWSEQCRALYADFGVDYSEYGLGRLADRCFPIALR